MKPRVAVLGGGITGQLVWHHIRHATVFDAGDGNRRLTRQWGANYLWEPIDGIRCYSFPVVTHIDGDPATPESMQAYKNKVGKGNESPVGWERQFKTTTTRYDFAGPIPAVVQYNMAAVQVDPYHHTIHWRGGAKTEYDLLVNTIPLPHFLQLMLEFDLGQKMVDLIGEFKQTPIFVRIQPRPIDAPMPPETMYVNYLTNPKVPAYRFCDRGQDRHYEGLTMMGTIPNKKIIPGKIHDLPDALMQSVYDELESYGIYCFGRFARWKSDELVHETNADITLFAQELGLV